MSYNSRDETHNKPIVQTFADWFFSSYNRLLIFFVIPQIGYAIIIFSISLTGTLSTTSLNNIAVLINTSFMYFCWTIELFGACLAISTQLWLLLAVIKYGDCDELIDDLAYATIPGFIILWVGLALCELNLKVEEHLLLL